MKKNNFTYSFTSSQSPDKIFALLQDIPQWWSGFYGENINGESKKPGDEFTFEAGGGMHFTKQKLVEAVPGKKISWLVTDSRLSFLSDPTEWKGTVITFDILGSDDTTTVTFTHEGLVPQIECYDQCSAGWTSYLGQLKEKLQ